MDKPQANGAPVQGTAVAKQNPNPQPPARQEQKPPLQEKTVNVHVKEPPALSVEDTIRRIEQLNEAITRRKILRDHLEKVDNLRFGEFDEKSSLVLVNSKGDQYPIRSAGLCQKIASLCKSELSRHIEEIEQQIVF
jgi:hypothetical protein